MTRPDECSGPRFEVAIMLASIEREIPLPDAERLLRTEHHRWGGTTAAYLLEAVELIGLLKGAGWREPALQGAAETPDDNTPSWLSKRVPQRRATDRLVMAQIKDAKP